MLPAAGVMLSSAISSAGCADRSSSSSLSTPSMPWYPAYTLPKTSGIARQVSTIPRRVLLITGDGPPDCATTTFRALDMTASPLRMSAVRLDAIERLARFAYEQDSFPLASGPLLRIDRLRIHIPQVHALTAFARDARGQRDLDAVVLCPASRVIGAQPAQVCGMREHPSRHVAEFVPLLKEIVAAVIADLVDQL